MSAVVRPRGASALRLAPSRTRTGPEPLSHVSLTLDLLPNVPADALYAGPPALTATVATLPGQSVATPFADRGIQVSARFSGTVPRALVVVVDLGANRDVARIELYGNLLLPPAFAGARPVHNFGIPRSLVVSAMEEEHEITDRHRRSEPGAFTGDERDVLARRHEVHDLRGLWGWTPVHLPPLFGRYLALGFGDFPMVLDPTGAAVPGIDIRALVVYPFRDDVDHTPHVEYAPALSRQRVYPQPSPYWSLLNVTPDTATSQSLLWDAAAQALLLPSALSGQPAVSPVAGPAPFYATDALSLDSAANDRAWLVLQATTDEIPIVDGVRLTFAATGEKGGYEGPKLPSRPDYLVAVHVTNSVEAAFSADPAHPAWETAAPERLVRASVVSASVVPFEAPHRARWVRLTVGAVAPGTIDYGGAVPFILHRLDLFRCRDFVLRPGPDEDVEVETVLFRFRGASLLDDYAYFDGASGVALSVEFRERGGSVQELGAFRTLLDLLENTHHRVFANHRRVEKPVQRTSEITRSRSRTRADSRAWTETDHTARVRPDFGNVVVTRAGTFTEFTDRPRDNLGDSPMSGLPNRTADGLQTLRTYAVDLDDVTLPTVDFANLDPMGLLQSVVEFGAELSAQGLPVSLGLGGNLGGNLGLALGLQGGASGGVSVSIGTQLGGGVTDSVVTGTQGSVAFTENRTVESLARTEGETTTDSTVRARSRGVDVREVTRRDTSREVRRRGLEVRYAGAYEDLVLASMPVRRLLRGATTDRAAAGGAGAPAGGEPDELRVRVTHTPPGVRLDVEFRGRIVPRARG